MSAVLGLSALYHDAAAALVVDGVVVAAMQEERFSRIKNDPALPLAAARACLAQAGLAPGDLDAVVFYENPFAKLERVLLWLLRTFPASVRAFPRVIAEQLGNKLWVLDAIAEGLGVERKKVEHVEHHRAHAASAFLVSPFDEAAILTVDGVGEHATTSLWSGAGTTVTKRSELGFPHSLGLFYGALTAYLGFEVNEGEYKVMGLAAFGAPRFRDELAKLVTLEPDGSFALGLPYFAYEDVGFSPRLEELLGPRRPAGKKWDLATEEDRRWADIAATTQAVTEDVLLALAKEARRRTGADALCLAGGVALNAVANARLLRESGFARVFVQPAAGDAGGALGAALLGAVARGDARPPPLATAALGQEIDPAAGRALADALGLRSRTVADPAAEVAQRLARNEIVAVAHGRFEWGPRALGQRSILARPEDPAIRERLNAVVKRREPFRPFAPAVPEAVASQYFGDAPNDMTPFMTTTCPVRGTGLGAVTHVDGSARVQTVTAASAPFLGRVLDLVGAATGSPVVLNTSLNGRGEPIVASATDALGFFCAHPVDSIVIGDLVVERAP